MTPSELDFVKGIFIACCLSIVLKTICNYFFYNKMPDKDQEILKRSQQGFNNLPPLTKRTVWLACIIYFLDLFVFINSAILVGMILRSYL